jgi:putative RecB family exonuclease
VTETRLEVVKNQPRSWSQLDQWEKCGHAYFLDRVERKWNRPASWLEMGVSVHEACELWERSGRIATVETAEGWFREAFTRDLNKTLDETPNLAFWESSGPYKGAADALRRYRVGLDHVRNYIAYYEDPKHWHETIWNTPDGTPAIELNFVEDFGSVKVRGKIDAVVMHPKKGLIVRDTKTGASPGSASQLKVYAEAVEKLTGVDVLYGDFFMTKRGTPTRTTDLTLVDRDEMMNRFEEMDQGVKSEVFTPNPGPNCARCSVRDSCVYRGEED